MAGREPLTPRKAKLGPKNDLTYLVANCGLNELNCGLIELPDRRWNPNGGSADS
jgi:hypothetical protein